MDLAAGVISDISDHTDDPFADARIDPPNVF